MIDKATTTPTEQDAVREAAASNASRLTALLSDPPTPVPCEDNELAAVDFTRLDVLIGTLRNDGQFDYCMAERPTTSPPRRSPPPICPCRSLPSTRRD